MKTFFASLHLTYTQTSICKSHSQYSPQYTVQIKQLTMKTCYEIIYDTIDNYYYYSCEGKLTSLEARIVIFTFTVRSSSNYNNQNRRRAGYDVTIISPARLSFF